jgi:hypothetical protein
MVRKPTYEELRQEVKELKKEATKHKRAEERAQRLNRLKEDLLASGSLNEKLKRITDCVVETFDADFCSSSLYYQNSEKRQNKGFDSSLQVKMFQRNMTGYMSRKMAQRCTLSVSFRPYSKVSPISYPPIEIRTVHEVACFLERLGGLETSEWKEACQPVNG